MKKFSNLTNNEIKVKELPLNTDQIINKLINENINVKIDGEDLVNKNISIDGKDELIKQVIDLIKQEEEKSSKEVSETLKYNFNHFINQNVLNKSIEKLYEENLNYYTVPSPDVVFASEDFEVCDNDAITLRSLNNVPTIYIDYLNLDETKNYFEDGSIRIRYISPDEGWEVKFEANLDKFGTSFSSNDDKYKKFSEKNIDFIKSFQEATSSLIGDAKIKFV